MKMRKLIALTVCALMLTAVFSCAASAAGETYVALGDSISAGYNLSGGHFDEECFVSIFARKNGFRKVNAAVDGMKADDVLDLLNSHRYDADLSAAKAVTITCGGNDLMAVLYGKLGERRGKSAEEMKYAFMNGNISGFKDAADVLATVKDSAEFKNALDTFISQLNEITAYIHRLNPSAVIITETQYNPYGKFTGLYKSKVGDPVGECVRELNKRIVSNAQTGGYLVADVYTAFEKSSENLCNASQSPIVVDFHPNAAGHAVIADCFMQAYTGEKATSFNSDRIIQIVIIAAVAAVAVFTAAGFIKSRKK